MQTPLQTQLLSQGKFSAEDLTCIAQCRGAHNRLGFAYQLAFVRLFNHFPSQQSFATHDELLTFVSLQLDTDVSVIRAYSQRRETVAEHQERICLYLGLSRFSEKNIPQVERFIFEEASRLEETSLLLAQTKRFLREHHIRQQRTPCAGSSSSSANRPGLRSSQKSPLRYLPRSANSWIHW